MSDDGKFGTLRSDLNPLKDRIDFFLTRFPKLYLAVEKHREWVNWDKRVYLSFVRRGDVVIDVGANVGAHAVFFSHLTGPHGKVIAFEPLPRNLEAMRSLFERRQRYANVTVIEAAVGNPADGLERTELLIPGSDATQASLKSQSAGSWSASVDVEKAVCAFTSLDRDVVVNTLDRLDFIKIDVEGGELDVLRGAARTISLHRPVIYCEAYENWTRSFGYGPADLISFVRSMGYQTARVIAGGRVHAHDLNAPAPTDWFSRSADILFVHDDRHPLTRAFDGRYLTKG